MKLPEIKNIIKHKLDCSIDGIEWKGKFKVRPFASYVHILTIPKLLHHEGLFLKLTDNAVHVAIMINEKTFINFKNKKIACPDFINTIAHESVHAIVCILESELIKDIGASEELFAYLIGQLTAEAFNVIMNK